MLLAQMLLVTLLGLCCYKLHDEVFTKRMRGSSISTGGEGFQAANLYGGTLSLFCRTTDGDLCVWGGGERPGAFFYLVMKKTSFLELINSFTGQRIPSPHEKKE